MTLSEVGSVLFSQVRKSKLSKIIRLASDMGEPAPERSPSGAKAPAPGSLVHCGEGLAMVQASGITGRKF